MIFAVRITAGRENQVIDKLLSLGKRGTADLYSILAPSGVKGYIFVEADNADIVQSTIYGVSHVKGVVKGAVPMKDIEHFLEPQAVQIKIDKNDIVEITSGPFKGTRAKVTRVNKLKEEIVVEPLEAAVPIPITVKLDNLRIIEYKSKVVGSDANNNG